MRNENRRLISTCDSEDAKPSQTLRSASRRATDPADLAAFGAVSLKTGRLMYINDPPSVEVDVKGLHISILSAEKEIELEGGLYELPEGLLPGTPHALQRTLVHYSC